VHFNVVLLTDLINLLNYLFICLCTCSSHNCCYTPRYYWVPTVFVQGMYCASKLLFSPNTNQRLR